jgi:hypothetical protein
MGIECWGRRVHFENSIFFADVQQLTEVANEENILGVQPFSQNLHSIRDKIQLTIQQYFTLFHQNPQPYFTKSPCKRLRSQLLNLPYGLMRLHVGRSGQHGL